MQPSESTLLSQIESFPRCPGVYLMRGADGTVLYIGKAIDLRSRVRSYFLGAQTDRFQIPALMRQTATIDWIATNSETEALILEANLVRTHQPKYNIDLRDDKHYPYLKVTLGEPFPRLLACRRVVQDRAKYFGPYTDVAAMRRTMRLAARAFKIRDCSRRLPLPKPLRPCINYSMGRCSGACAGKISAEEYGRNVRMLMDFLSGRRSAVTALLRQDMEDASNRRDYETAARIRDQIELVSRDSRTQSADLRLPSADCDVFGVCDTTPHPCLAVLNFREGILLGKRHFLFSRQAWQAGAESRDRLIVQFYDGTANQPPSEVILPPAGGFNTALLADWSAQRWGRRISFTLARKGRKAALLRMAEKNALLYAAQRNPAEPTAAIEEFARVLSLPRPPAIIEAFDISNLGESFAVAGMVRFVNGRPDTAGYRRYKIRTVQGQNDVAMMMEAVQRRLARLCAESKPLPDLLLIDGGLGQLHAAMEPLKTMAHPPAIVALAKQEELLYSPFAVAPVRLASTHPVRKLAERIRDEAHRYTLAYHRRLRGTQFHRSALESIAGVGAARASRLLKRFGSLHAIRAASVEEIAQTPGVPRELAERIANTLTAPPGQAGG